MTKLKCSKCNEDCYFIDITKSKDIKELFGCACDMCKTVLCRNCYHLSSSEIRVLCMTRNILKYFCTTCLGLFNTTVSDLPQINNRITILEKETKELKEKMENNAPTYAQVVADTSDLKKEMEKLSDEVVKQKMIPKAPTPRDFNLTVEPTLCEMAEREKRAANIILFGIKENNLEQNENAHEIDLNKAVDIVKQVKRDIQKRDIKVYRLGTPAQGKVRPLRIVTASPTIAKEILRKKSMLKEENMYLKADQTPLQREYLKTVLKELEERKQKGEVNIRVKYINNIPKIVFSQNNENKNSKN